MYLCIDIGGTKTLIAAFSKRGRVVRRRKFKTAQGYRDFTRELSDNLNDFLKYKVRGVVVAIPGVVREVAGDADSASCTGTVFDAGAETGVVSGNEQKSYSITFGNRNWTNIDLLTPIKKLFSCPIWFENDANLASLYEGFRLPGKTVFLTFSTGIGGGVVEHNRILPESDDLEPGHVVYTYKGETKEWEDLAAASALEKVYHIERATSLRGKDELRDVAARIALGLPDIVREHQPRFIVLGGPLGKIFRLYAKYLPEELRKLCRPPKRPTESVIYGGYIYAKQKERE